MAGNPLTKDQRRPIEVACAWLQWAASQPLCCQRISGPNNGHWSNRRSVTRSSPLRLPVNYRDTTKNRGGLARMFGEPHTPHCMPFPTLGNGVSEGRRKLATGKFHT